MLEDLLGKEWHPFVTFLDIINSLPKYVDKLHERESQNLLYCDQRATYELNQVYDISKFEDWPDTCFLFDCIEYEPDTEEFNTTGPTSHKAMISDNVILILEEIKQEGEM